MMLHIQDGKMRQVTLLRFFVCLFMQMFFWFFFSHLTVVTVVAWAAHGVPGAALSVFLALKARATREEAKLLASALRVSCAHEQLHEGKSKQTSTQTKNINITKHSYCN